MGNEVLSYRDEVTRRVVKSLARVRASGDMFSVRNQSGAAPIIVTLPEDRVGDVEDRVRGMGGAANVVLAYPENFVIWSWDSTIDVAIESVDVHEESTMDMLHMWLLRCEGNASNLNVVRSALSNQRELSYQF